MSPVTLLGVVEQNWEHHCVCESPIFHIVVIIVLYAQLFVQYTFLWKYLFSGRLIVWHTAFARLPSTADVEGRHRQMRIETAQPMQRNISNLNWRILFVFLIDALVHQSTLGVLKGELLYFETCLNMQIQYAECSRHFCLIYYGGKM